ncbi:MAG: glycosyltransferase 87 family protein [Actinomycetota bacterium]|nr:glycosyltransferase 87 family protein [Actinomycetota bacterium]
MLLGGFMLKAQCTAAEGWDGRQYSRLCYNDVQALYALREIDSDTFPYVEGRLRDQKLSGGAIEYPVLTGVFMWLSGLLVEGPNSYLRVTAILLMPFAMVTAYLLARMRGPRALMWAAAPALVLYSFHNWDLLAVAAAVGGIWFWWRERDIAAAVLLGVGGAFKLYPVFLLAPLALYAGRRRGWRGAVTVSLAGAGTLVGINLPFALANFDGWIATYRFHSLRVGNFDSIWNLGFSTLDAATLNVVTGGMTALAFLAALVVGWFRSRDGSVYPFLEVAAAMVAAFLLFSKVHSPQYTLWILPFFALTNVSIAWWVAYSLVDLGVYVGVFRWFYDFIYEGEDFTFFKKLMIAGVWSRAVLLAALFIAFLAVRRRVEPASEEVAEEPAPATGLRTALESGG